MLLSEAGPTPQKTLCAAISLEDVGVCPSPGGNGAPDDDQCWVVWSQCKQHVHSLLEEKVLATVQSAKYNLLLEASYVEPGGGPNNRASLLDLAVRFGHEALAAKLAGCGVPALGEPAVVAVPGWGPASNPTVEKIAAAGRVARAALAAGLKNREAAKVLWVSIRQRSLLDLAILAGDGATAQELRAQGVLRRRRYSFEDFVSDQAIDGLDALGFHFSLALLPEIVDAGLRGGVNFEALASIRDTSGGSRVRLSVLDAAILGGHCVQAAGLAASGCPSILEGSLSEWFLMQNEAEDFLLDAKALEAAFEAKLEPEAMTMDVVGISFGYPMKKCTKAFSLLDVAVSIGQEDVARRLASRAAGRMSVQGSVPSMLVEAHLLCREQLFALSFWQRGNKKSLSRKMKHQVLAATVAAAELDRAKDREMLEHFLLFAQWGRLWRCPLLFHPTLLRDIFEYMLPKILLTLPRLEELINAQLLHVDGGAPVLSFPAQVPPESAARLVRKTYGEQ